MTYGEAIGLVKQLAADTSSRTAASLAGWDRPVDAAALVLMDLYDLTHHVAWGQAGGKGQRPKPYPRPWPDKTRTRTKPEVTQAQVIEALRFAGHTKPIPTKEV